MKMQIIRMMRNVVIVSSVSILGACTGVGGGGYITKTMSDKEFLNSPEKRDDYLTAIAEEERVIQLKKDAEYDTGRPVKYGEPDTGFTIQWNKKLGQVYTFLGHSSGALHAETEGVMAYVADENGNMLFQDAGNGFMRPTALLENVTTRQGLGRVFIDGSFRVASASLNGVLAAKVHADKDCGNNCDNVTVYGASASAEGVGNANAATTANSIVNSGCGADCDDLN